MVQSTIGSSATGLHALLILYLKHGEGGGLPFNEVVESLHTLLILYFHIASREGGLSFSELVEIDGNLRKIVFGVHGQFPF